MRVLLSSNPYRDRGLRAALEAKKILERAGVEAALCLPFVPKKGDRLELSHAATLMELIDLTQEKVLVQEDVDQEYLSGFSNGSVNWMDLDFFWPPAEDFTVEVVPLSEGEPYTLTMDAQDTALPVVIQQARYIVRATLAGENGTRYQAEYQFILENGA